MWSYAKLKCCMQHSMYNEMCVFLTYVSFNLESKCGAYVCKCRIKPTCKHLNVQLD